MFSGIGGFRLGFEQAGFKCIGHCENDKFALKSYNAMFNTKGEWFSDNIKTAKADEMPNADIWCFGFPCSDLSASGRGFAINGARSGLYFEVIRLLKEKENKPRWLVVENVKNLLSINKGFDFYRVLREMDEAGYDAQWQLINSAAFGVPQNRERVFIIGHLRGTPGGKVFPIQGENFTAIKQVIGGSQGNRVYDTNGLACTQLSSGGGMGAKTGMYVCAVLTPERENKRQNGRRIKSANEPMFTLTTQDRHGALIKYPNSEIRIRRLTPRECFRLQGFPDEYFEKARAVNSDSQLYRQAGNAVTVNVAYEIAKKIKRCYEK